ncbi:MAG: sigma-70 family RNA polymerase sigma factor [Defluviitaleaceae bacterium]|nr:sigma-70 family RNA polymerase sigma factor [Defluviitaleaceae bacterium]
MENSMENQVNEARSGNTAALNALMQSFKPLVKAKAKEYYLQGGDLEDLIQEGMIGLYKAVQDYAPAKGSFSAFAGLCVMRQIQTAIKAAARQKHMPLNTSLSLDESPQEGNETLANKLTDYKNNDPETLLLSLETYATINNFINQNLTELERQVLTLHMNKKSHKQIAEQLGKTTRSVDNTLQRIRKKLKTIM